MKLVVGLGNPGRPYARTRHNVGFEVVETLGRRWSIAVQTRQHGSLVGDGRVGQQRALLACPQSFMNVSGAPVASLLGYYKCALQDLVVVHDELELAFGEVEVKVGGGHKGHNGLRDVARHVGAEFVRIRVGIGRPPAGWDPADYVLGRWTEAEAAQLPSVLDRAADAVEEVLNQGTDSAMLRFNSRSGSGAGSPGGRSRPSSQRSRRTTPHAPAAAREEL